ncbi:MAG: GNAT family N-acetyltransferase [Pseudomonadota bacterium]
MVQTAPSLSLRDLQASELASLLRLYAQLHPTDDPLPPAAEVEALWTELLASGRYRYFGGFIADRLVSTCTLAVIPNLTRGCRPYGLIENVVTDVAWRGHGYGKALLVHAQHAAWDAGCYKVMLMTSRQDPATLGFYRAAGFDGDGKRAFVARPPAA